ncbi:MAG: 4Fe-4S binding protein [Desulfurococcales archaeon]|nr:4Fe-4S binding protein [Desulfurococcales archaeon]
MARLRINEGTCLNTWYRKGECTLCVDHCPLNAIRLEGRTPRIDPDKCIACGACTAACPTESIELVGLEEKVEEAIEEAVRSSKALRISCREKGEGVLTTCINALRLEHYYIMASKAGRLEVDARCKGCPLEAGRGWERAERASRELGERVKVETGEAPRLQALRRAAIKAVLLTAAKAFAGIKVRPVRVEVVESRGPVRARGRLRRMAMRAAGEMGVEFRRPRPQVNGDLCTMTGICAGVCPVGAITFNEAGVLSFDLEACVSCGVCAEVCPESAIEMVVDGEKGVVRVYKGLIECPRCGYTYPSSLKECPRCSTLKEIILDFYMGKSRSCEEYRRMLASRFRGGGEGSGGS